MHIRRFTRWQIRPELLILKLEFDHSGGQAILLGDKKQAPLNFCFDARWNKLIIAPHGHAALPEPLRCLTKDFSNLGGILWSGLADNRGHRSTMTLNSCFFDLRMMLIWQKRARHTRTRQRQHDNLAPLP